MALTNYRSISGSVGGAGGGSRAYGTVPAPIAVPPNIYTQLGSVPGLNFSNLTSTASGNIMNELNGELSPQTIRDIQDEAARFGVTSGMPGSQFAGYRGLRNLGINAENYRRQGLQDYGSLTSSLAPLQTNPELATNIADRNSVYAAAPDPQAAAEQQMANFEKELKDITSGRLGGGTGGGSGGGWRPGPIPLAPAPSPGGGTGNFSTTHSNPFNWTDRGGTGPVWGGGGGGGETGSIFPASEDAAGPSYGPPSDTIGGYSPTWSSNVMGGGAPNSLRAPGFYAGPQGGEGDWMWDPAARAYMNIFNGEYGPIETGGG